MAEQTYMKIAGIDGMPTIGGASINAWTLPPAVNRYEKTIFSSTNGNGVSAGNVTEPFSAFDEIGICLAWPDHTEVYGKNYIWFNQKTFNVTTGECRLLYNMGDPGVWRHSQYFLYNTMNFNNTAKSFYMPNNMSTQYWGMITPTNNTTTIKAYNSQYRNQLVSEIIGVKYQ